MQYLSALSVQVLVLFTFCCVAFCEPTVQELKCQVCKALVTESVAAIAKVDPKKKIPVGSFRLQADGTQKQKSATHKENGELILVNLSKDVDKLSTYQVVPDPTANGKIRQLCEDMIGEYEDDYMRVFSKHKIRVEPQAFRLLCENNKEICGEKAKEEL
ncbi:hypothetical protein MTO96_051146 [Rhipicephalus appendiculatus]